MPKIFKFLRKESYSFISSFYICGIGEHWILEIKFDSFFFFFFLSFYHFLICACRPRDTVLIFSNVVKGTTKFYGFFFFLQTKQWNFNIINSLKKEENSRFKIKLILIIPNTRSLNW